MKNRLEDLNDFKQDLASCIEELKVNYDNAYEDMENEFDCLIQSLQVKKEEFLQTVDDEHNEKFNKLQVLVKTLTL